MASSEDDDFSYDIVVQAFYALYEIKNVTQKTRRYAIEDLISRLIIIILYKKVSST